jgi:protease-4
MLAEKKPLVVSMGEVAASGGYYIAAPAHKIFALPTTLTGSIGVISIVPNIARFEEKYGINLYTFTVSDRKNLINPSDRPSNEDKQALAARSDFTYQRFAEVVAKGRELPLERVHALAQGRVWSGRQAKENGLVDELGDLYDAFQEAKKLAGFDSETLVPILQWPGSFSSLPHCLSNPRSCLPQFWESSQVAPRFLESLGARDEAQLRRVSKWLLQSQREPVQAIWPGYWQLRNP